jgi:hypothetical protein
VTLVRKREDEFLPNVRDTLARRVGYRCSKPSCRALTTGPNDKSIDSYTNVGVASHITAAAPGGPRFDPNLSSTERRSIKNGIWLCQIHAKEIDDDPIRYSTDILLQWKHDAEHDARSLLGKPISPSLPTFIKYKEFFKPFLNGDNLFNHVYPFIGRQTTLDELNRFTESNKRISILLGRGGIGKSRILFEFCKTLELNHSEWKVRFLKEDAKLTNESNFQQLLAHKIIFVVDDAHRRNDDLPILFGLTQQYPERFKIILSLRNHGLDNIKRLIMESGFDIREIEEIPEIKELSRDELEELGKNILGKNSDLVDAILKVAKDSTLVLVIGCRLISEGKIFPGLLENFEEFRRTVFDRFQDVLFGKISERIGNEICKKVLTLISALTPINPEEQGFQEFASQFLGIDRNTLIDVISILEHTRILIRRGNLLRITPDVLSDYILHNACLTIQNEPTGYAERLFLDFGQNFIGNLLFNLSELDWRVTLENESKGIMNNIWAKIEGLFKQSSHYKRIEILHFLEKISHYQPARTLTLIEYVIDNPTGSSKETTNEFLTFNHKQVIEAIPKVIKGISYHLDYLTRCCNILWQLSKNDLRETNPYPEHPIKVLIDLASIEPHKPLKVNQILLEAAEKWLEERDAFQYKFSPIDIINPIFAKEGHTTVMKGFKLISTPFFIDYENTKPLRKYALDLLRKTAKSGTLKAKLRVVKSLTNALRPPFGLLGAIVSPEYRDLWTSDQIEILGLLSSIIQENINEPILLIYAIDDLRIYSNHSDKEIIREKAKNIIQSMPDSFNLRLTKALLSKHDIDWTKEKYQEGQKRIEEEVLVVLKEFLDKYNDPLSIFSYLDRMFQYYKENDVNIQPEYFLQILSQTNMVIGIQLCKIVISHNPSMLDIYISNLVSGIREDVKHKLFLIRSAIKTKNKMLCLSIANGYAWWVETITNKDFSCIKKLLKNPDILIRKAMLNSMIRLGKVQPQKTIKLMMTVKIGRNEQLGDSYCEVFDSQYGIPFEDLTEKQVRTILFRLMNVKELDDHLFYLNRFISYCCSRIPKDSVCFLLKRLDIYELGNSVSGFLYKIKPLSRLFRIKYLDESSYHPFPYLGFNHSLDSLSAYYDYKKLLRTVRNRYKIRTYNPYLKELYSAISNNYSPSSLEVLEEWLNTDDANKIEAVGYFLEGADPEFVFLYPDFVSKTLNNANKINDECLRIVNSSLLHIATSGGRHGVMGEPFPEDIRLKEQAQSLAITLPAGSIIQRFYLSLVDYAEEAIKRTILQAEGALDD